MNLTLTVEIWAVVSATILVYRFVDGFIKYRKWKQAERKEMKIELSVTDNMLSVTDNDKMEEVKEEKDTVYAARKDKEMVIYENRNGEEEVKLTDEEKEEILESVEKQWTIPGTICSNMTIEEEQLRIKYGDLEELTIRELKGVAKELKLKGYSRLKKERLLNEILGLVRA